MKFVMKFLKGKTLSVPPCVSFNFIQTNLKFSIKNEFRLKKQIFVEKLRL